MHLPLLTLLAGCADDADLTYGIVCEDVSLSDEVWNGTSLEAERARLAATGAELDLDWNTSNEVGVPDDFVVLEPGEFLAETGALCSRTDGESSALAAPIALELVGESWVPNSQVEGTLDLDHSGQIFLTATVELNLPAEVREAATVLIEDAMDAEVDANDLPQATLTVRIEGDDAGTATLEFTRDATQRYADADQPEPMGQEIPLAQTYHR